MQNDNLEEQIELFCQYLLVANANLEWNKGTISDLREAVGGCTPSKARSEYYTENGVGLIATKKSSLHKEKTTSLSLV